MSCQKGDKLQYIVMGRFRWGSFLLFLINRYGVVFWIELDSLNRDRRSAHISGDFFDAVSIEAPLSSLKKRIICILKNCFKKGSNASIIECIGIAGCPIMSISPLKWPTPPYRKSSKTYHFAIHVESIKTISAWGIFFKDDTKPF